MVCLSDFANVISEQSLLLFPKHALIAIYLSSVPFPAHPISSNRQGQHIVRKNNNNNNYHLQNLFTLQKQCCTDYLYGYSEFLLVFLLLKTLFQAIVLLNL